MSDKREVFTILEDNTSAEGVKLPARVSGDTVGGNNVPVLAGKDDSGNFIHLPVKQAGNAPDDAQPSLSAVDVSGNLQYTNIRAAGADPVGSAPVLPALDSSGKLSYLHLNADLELLVSNEPSGTKKFGTAIVTPGSINTLTTVVNVALTISEVYEKIQVRASCFFPTLWEVVKVDDVTLTVLDSFLTGSGMFTFSMKYEWMTVTAGGSGTQQLRLRATQNSGSPSDFHGYVEAFEKA